MAIIDPITSWTMIASSLADDAPNNGDCRTLYKNPLESFMISTFPLRFIFILQLLNAKPAG